MTTIRDVARLAGVSTATVSRVLNSPEAVRSHTREKVVRAMEKCRYRYNALAGGFKKKQSRTIGVVIPSITNPIFAESTRGAQDAARERGYHVVLGNTDYTPGKEEETVSLFREIRVDGMIITASGLKHDWLRKLNQDKVPLVVLHSTLRTGNISCVGVDNFQGGYMATQHLIDAGHRRIGMVAGKFTASDKSYHRWYGFMKCLRDNGLDYDSGLLQQMDYALENGKQGIQRLMTLAQPPTGVFCSNDYLALGAMKGAREMGLEIPADLSVVGFDDMPMAAFFHPGLDTVRQPAYDMGKTGVQVLLDMIRDTGRKPVQQLLDLELIRRESVSPPKKDPA